MRRTRTRLGLAVSLGLMSATGAAAEGELGLSEMTRCYGYNYLIMQSQAPLGQDIRRYIWMLKSWEEKIREVHGQDEALLREKMNVYSAEFEKDLTEAVSRGGEGFIKFMDAYNADCVPFEDENFPGWDEYSDY